MTKHTTSSSSLGPAAVATVAAVVALLLGAITGLWIAIDALNGTLGVPMWAIGRGLLLAGIAADVVFMARVARALRGQR